MPSRGYTPRTIRGLGSFVLLKVPAGTLGTDAPENTWEWLPIAQVTDAIEIRMMTSEIDVSSPWNSWSVFTLGRKNVESLIVPVLYNPSLMAHSFVHSNGAPRKFLDRTFETWRVWTKSNDLEGSVCMEFSAAVSAMAIMIPSPGPTEIHLPVPCERPSKSSRLTRTWMLLLERLGKTL